MLAAAVLAGFVALQPPANLPRIGAAEGEWLVISVARVIAPDQHPGECYVQARVEQVVRGRVFKVGDTVGISLRCRNGGGERVAFAAPREPLTIQALKSQKRALVHVDAGGRVLENAYYGLTTASPAQPT